MTSKRLNAISALVALVMALACTKGQAVALEKEKQAPDCAKCDGEKKTSAPKWHEVFRGTWTGYIHTASGRTQPVQLVVDPSKPEKIVVTLIYGNPRGCTLHAEYSGPGEHDAAEHIFSLFSKNGGVYCDRLMHGSLQLKKQGNDQLTYVTQKPESGVAKETGNLTRQ